MTKNKNRFLILEIRDTTKGEEVLMRYIKEPNDPHHDDLPSEMLKPGTEVYVDFTLVNKVPAPEFNNGDSKK